MRGLSEALRPRRIVSLLPSATEIVCALGAERELVGISHECDFPVAIAGRPVLTRARIDASGSSRAIDAAVRAVARDALSIYLIDDAKLAALEPDVIVTQDLCEVCAVSLDDVRAAVARLVRRERVHVISLKPTRLDDMFGDVLRVARAIDRTDEGERLQAELRERIRAIAGRAAQSTTRPRVVSLEWIDPLMIGGTWMPELVLHAGGEAVGVVAGHLALTVNSETLASLRPEVIVVKPCGFPLDRTMVERDVIQRSVLDVTPSDTRVYVTDGNAFFNRPGPRLVESLEIMAACVHPARFEDLAKKHRDVIRRLR
jgi:iron complex transport system substrate-binding protein